MNSTHRQFPAWAWVVAGIFALSVVASQFRSCVKQDANKGVQQILLHNYGDAIQDYRSDPIRFRARIQELVRQGHLTQEEADESVELVRRMSQSVP